MAKRSSQAHPAGGAAYRDLAGGVAARDLAGGVAARHAQARAWLRVTGLRVTKAREAVLAALADDCTHPTAEALFQRVRRRVPGLSRATVYNCLEAFVASGRVGALDGRTGGRRFDPNLSEHHHAVCSACGAIADVPKGAVAIAKLPARVAGGFRVDGVDLRLVGRCDACAKKRAGA